MVVSGKTVYILERASTRVNSKSRKTFHEYLMKHMNSNVRYEARCQAIFPFLVVLFTF